MDRRMQRQLRHNASCTPFTNIFKNEDYILNSGCHFLPQDIFQKINRFHAITCDEINSLTFVRNQPHQHILNRMNEAFNLQSKMINQNLNSQSGESSWRQEVENERVRLIQSDDCKQEILNDQSFKNYLEHLLNQQ